MLLLAEQNRVFGYAAAASLALHALLLSIQVPLLRQPAPEPPEPPLVAHLAEPPPAPAPAPPAPAVQQPEPPKPKPAAKAKPKSRPKPMAKAVPKPSTPLPIPEPAPPPLPTREIPSEPAPSPAPAPAPAPAAPAAPVASVAPRAPAAPDTEQMVAGFRRQLVAAAVRYKRYPRVALDNGWTGDVVLRIEVDARGRIASLEVKSGSGHDVLDEQALEMFRKAAAEVPVPAALRGKAFPVEVRAIYNLRDRPG